MIDKQFISLCVDFSVENKFLERDAEYDQYSLTSSGREFISSQFG